VDWHETEVRSFHVEHTVGSVRPRSSPRGYQLDVARSTLFPHPPVYGCVRYREIQRHDFLDGFFALM